VLTSPVDRRKVDFTQNSAPKERGMLQSRIVQGSNACLDIAEILCEAACRRLFERARLSLLYLDLGEWGAPPLGLGLWVPGCPRGRHGLALL